MRQRPMKGRQDLQGEDPKILDRNPLVDVMTKCCKLSIIMKQKTLKDEDAMNVIKMDRINRSVECWFEKCRANLVRQATKAERIFMHRLNMRRMNYKFQYILYPYILDFYFPDQAVVVEIDGKHHEHGKQRRRDIKRDLFLQSLGLIVKRIPNRDIHRLADSTIDEILILPMVEFSASEVIRSKARKLADEKRRQRSQKNEHRKQKRQNNARIARVKLYLDSLSSNSEVHHALAVAN